MPNRDEESLMRRALSAALMMLLALGLVLGLSPRSASAANQPTTYVDFPFDSTNGTDPTADKPQSKLWHHDGFWWAVMFSTSANSYHIYRLNWPAQWIDTGTAVDDRPLSRADALWNGQYLYIVSTLSNVSSSSTASAANEGRLYRYKYSSSAKTYTLDSPPGPYVVVMTGSTETLTIDQDSTGRLWVTFTQGKRVYVNSSIGNSSTNDDLRWNTKTILPNSQQVGSDDIAALVAYKDKNGPSVGVLWSSHTSTTAASYMYFAYHKDTDPVGTWQIEQIYGGTGTCLADDHINLKSIQADPYGRIFAAVKTSVGDSSSCTGGTDLIRLVVRYPDNTWKTSVFGNTSDKHTRPIVLLDSENSKVYMFATAPTSCGTIYMKSTSMNNPSFASGKGTAFIGSTDYTCINNATSTKQTVDSSTGLVVLASDGTKRYYLHGALALGSTQTDTTPPAVTAKTPVPGATGVDPATSVTATFSEPVSGVGSSTFTLTSAAGSAVSAAVSYNAATQLATLQPSASLAPGTTYIASLTAGVKDAANNALVPYSWSFTTAAAPTGGTRIKDITFENGSLTNPTSGADTVVGTVALETAAPLKGAYAATINTTSGYLREDLVADELFVSFYIKVNTRNATTARIAQISNSGTTVGSVFLTNTGALQLKNNGTTIGTSTQTLALGTLYRIGVHQKLGTGGNAVLEAYLATGDAAFTTPFASSATQTFTSQATRFSLGATNSNAVNITVDDIRLDTGVMP